MPAAGKTLLYYELKTKAGNELAYSCNTRCMVFDQFLFRRVRVLRVKIGLNGLKSTVKRFLILTLTYRMSR